MSRIGVQITSTVIMTGIGGLLASPVWSGMMVFFFISAVAYNVQEIIRIFFGDDWI